jgi:outer membrane protein
MIRSLVTTFPAAGRFAFLTAQQGPVYALADAVLPAIAGLARTSSTKRNSPMSKLTSGRLVAALLLLAIVAGPAAAQPTTQTTPSTAPAAESTVDTELASMFVDGGLTADAAAKRSVSASPEVWRKAAEVEQAIAEVDAVKIQRIPALSYQMKYTRLSDIDSPELAPGVEFPVLLNKQVYEAKLVVPISDQFIRLPNLIKAAKAGEKAARVDQTLTELDAMNNARVTYYEWVRSKLQLVISQRQLTGVRATLDQVRALASAQKVSKADLLRMESEEATAEQTVDQLQTIADLREEMLRIIIGAKPSEKLEVGEDLRDAFEAPAASSLDDLTQKASKQRLEFRKIELGLDANQARSAAERASYLPRLSAFAVADYANPSDRALPPEDEFSLTWAAGVQVDWQLNDALTARTTKHKLRAEATALRADRQALLYAARLELLSAQQDVALAQNAMETSQKGLVAAEEGYRVRKAQLDAERATAVELVDAETELTRARIAALDARIDLRIARTQLDHALGNDAE